MLMQKRPLLQICLLQIHKTKHVEKEQDHAEICITQKHRQFLTDQNLHAFLDRLRLKLERSKEVKTRFLNIQPSLSEMELPLRFIFALNIMQINKERNHSTVNPNTKARY